MAVALAWLLLAALAFGVLTLFAALLRSLGGTWGGAYVEACKALGVAVCALAGAVGVVWLAIWAVGVIVKS